jgi:predicted transcriptional regulator
MSQLAQDSPKTEFIGTHVDPLTRDELIALARREDRSMSWVLRRALTAYLERAGHTRDEGAAA